MVWKPKDSLYWPIDATSRSCKVTLTIHWATSSLGKPPYVFSLTQKSHIYIYIYPHMYIYIYMSKYIHIYKYISIYIPMIYHYSHQPWNSPLCTTKKHGICSPYTSSTIATALCPATSRAPPAREHWRSRRSPPGPVETPRAPGELEVSTWRIYGWYMVNIYIYIYECIDV